jgi:hypothetical protein
MTFSGSLQVVDFPPAPCGTTHSQWLALVYPVSARPRSQPWTVALHSPPLAVLHPPDHSFLLLGGVFVRFATIGSVPRTR